MDKLKVMTIIGTRPEIIRLSECIKACDRHFFRQNLKGLGDNVTHRLSQMGTRRF